jgi:K+-sensing histidine kinase KdpD
MNATRAAAAAAGLVIATAAFASTGTPHAAAINAFFADILLVVSNLKSLIEPIVGLAVAAMIAMQYVTMRRQTQSKAERAEQTTVLAEQNDQLAHISRQVETVKAVVTPPEPNKEPQP